MKIIWLGHGSFRIEISDQVLLVDPWLTCPTLPENQRGPATAGATHILITHGHFDHASDALTISKEQGVPIVCIYDLASFWEASEGVTTIGFNKGGTIMLGDVSVTMVNAVHSSSIGTSEGPLYSGSEAGYMISAEGHTVYVSGDTDIMADMEWMADVHKPDIGILCAGGHFTMDMERAAYAAKRYFNFKAVIPCHYRTFPILEQSADRLKAGLPGVNVMEPEVMETIEI
ncbi:MAG: metal-dependent hydrolase [Pseudomonadota bacterium]